MPLDIILTKESAVIALYTISGAVGVTGFIPQIWKLITSTGKSKAISLQTYAVWWSTAAVSWLYGIMILHDFMASAIAAGFTIGNTLIIALTIYNRYFRFADSAKIVNIKASTASQKQRKVA